MQALDYHARWASIQRLNVSATLLWWLYRNFLSIRKWAPNLSMARGQPRYCGLLRVARLKESGIPNRLKFYLIFIVYNEFTDVTASRIIQLSDRGFDTHVLEYYCWARVNNWYVRVGDLQRVLLSYWEPQLLRTVAGFLCGKAAVLGEPIKGRPRVSHCKHFAPRPCHQPVGNTEPSYSSVICYKGNEEASPSPP